MPQRSLNRVLAVVGLLFSVMLIASIVFTLRVGIQREIERNHEQTRAAVADVRAIVELNSERNRVKLDELLRRVPAATEPSR